MSSQGLTSGGRSVTTAPSGVLARTTTALSRNPRARLALLLSAPMFWLVVLYLGSLATMFAASVWQVDSFTGQVQRTFTWDNFHTLLTNSVYRTIALRTVMVALIVTVLSAVIAVPVALLMAKGLRSSRTRALLVIAISMPLWANYLVKGYAWRIMFDERGVLDWALHPLGGHTPGLGLTATTVALLYLWLPYMILPVYAAFERLPNSLIDAAFDLGGRPWFAFRTVILPLVMPGVIAGSIFTFSLTLGDYIMVKIVGRATQLYANVVYDNIGVAGDLPFAAAAAVFPVLVVVGYLVAVRRTGALESL
ncbi:MAG: ABC transporter permease [Actinobacteria bacterium]|nr:ABC transporter permease [Actinomycetota bacterium]